MDLVSVIIPTYQGYTTLPRAIKSVLEQTYQNFEIIVVDDNNPETKERKLTEECINAVKDSRITYYKHDRNINGSAARNTGIRHAKGDFIMFLDDDDEFMPQKMEAQLTQLKNMSSEYGANYTQYRKYKDGVLFEIGSEKVPEDTLANQLARNFFVQAGSNLMIRRSVVEKIGFFDETFQRNQDLEYMVRILEEFKISMVDIIGLNIYLQRRVGTTQVNLQTLTEKYKNTFKVQIEANERKKDINRMLDVQVLRYHLSTKNIKEFITYKRKNNVSTLFLISYAQYLCGRKIRKSCYGFKL